jgi:hypothetical protein
MAIDSTIKAAYLEELRFAKRQQWAVAIAAITLIAGAFHIAHNIKEPLLICWETLGITLLVCGVAGGGCWLLWKLQHHLRRIRLHIDPLDKTPFLRGSEVAFGLGFALIISAVAVSYSLWRELLELDCAVAILCLINAPMPPFI